MTVFKRVTEWLFPGGPGGLTELENREYDELLKERASQLAAGFTRDHKAARDMLVAALKLRRIEAKPEDVPMIDATLANLDRIDKLFK